MGDGQWRELIESYVAGRLSAASFKRRFLEAFSGSALVPQSIQELYFTVDAYAGDPMGRGHDVADDAALMVAARRALLGLAPGAVPPQAQAPPQPGQATGPRTSAPRGPFGTPPILATGLGLGCLIIGLWAAVGILQLFAIAEQVDRVTQLGPVISTVSAFILTFLPVVGSVIAFFGAMDGWRWNPWVAGLVFLVVPMTVQAISLFSWRRTRR